MSTCSRSEEDSIDERLNMLLHVAESHPCSSHEDCEACPSLRVERDVWI